MNVIHREQLVNQLNWRYATKQFDPGRKIASDDWAALEEALVLTPSSFGLQPWKFIVVKDPATREKLVAASWGQRQVAEASHLVVFTAKQKLNEADIDSFMQRIAEVRNVPASSLSGYRDIMVGSLIQGMDAPTRAAWAARQAYIALGNLLNSAALLGIDACPMEGIDRAQYDQILHLTEQGLGAVMVCTLGYRAVSDKYASLKKVRFQKAEVLVNI